MTLTAKQLLIDLLGRDYLYQELDGDFTLITDKKEVEEVTSMLASDIKDIKHISKFHTIAGYIKTNNHYFEFLHFNEPENLASGYIIYDYTIRGGVWVKEARHNWAPDYAEFYGKEEILKSKLIEDMFKLPCFVD